jgi:hypothetical protein
MYNRNPYLPFRLDNISPVKTIILMSILGLACFLIPLLISTATENFEPYNCVSFADFNAAEINGHIRYCSPLNSKQGYYFDIKEAPLVHYRARLVQMNREHAVYQPNLSFNDLASVGDAIVKHRYDNTLELITEKGTLYFHIYPPINNNPAP